MRAASAGPLLSPTQWSDELFVRDTTAEAAAGERFVSFMQETRALGRGKKPPPRVQYKPLRTTAAHDPTINTRLKTADVDSHWDLEAEDGRHWQASLGGTFARGRRFPKGDTLIDQRKLHQPAQRFYNVDKGRSMGKRTRPARSVWPRAETKSEFEIAQAKRVSADNAALSVELGNPYPDRWVAREVCGEVPGSAMFRSTSDRALEKLDGFTMVGVEHTGGPRKGPPLPSFAEVWPTSGPRPRPSPHGQAPPIEWLAPSAGFQFPKADRMTHADVLLHTQIAQRRTWIRTTSQIPGAERLIMPYDGDKETLRGVHGIPRASYIAGMPVAMQMRATTQESRTPTPSRAASTPSALAFSGGAAEQGTRQGIPAEQ